MLPRLLFCLLAFVLLSVIALAQQNAAPDQKSKLQDELIAQERKLIDAINKKDKAAIARMLADERMSIVASRGRQTTAEIVAGLERISFTDHKISDAKTIPVTPEVAILTYKFSWTGAAAGQTPATTIAYATSVWRKADGRWRSVFYQETPAPR
jgi:ketosteroid isomerase-like protein